MKQRLFTLTSALSLLIFGATLALWIVAAVGGESVWRQKSATFSRAFFLESGYLHYESLTDPSTTLISAMNALNADRPLPRAKEFEIDSHVILSLGNHFAIASGNAHFFGFSGTIFAVTVNYLPIVLLSAIAPIVWIYGKLRRPAD